MHTNSRVEELNCFLPSDGNEPALDSIDVGLENSKLAQFELELELVQVPPFAS